MSYYPQINYITLAVKLTKDEYDVIVKHYPKSEQEYNDYKFILLDNVAYAESDTNYYTKETTYFFYLDLYQEEVSNQLSYNISLTGLQYVAWEINSYLNYVFNDNVTRDVELIALTKQEIE